METYKEIAQLILEGKSQRSIAARCGVSSKTIVKVRRFILDNDLTTDLLDTMTEEEIKNSISPKKEYITKKEKPNYAAVQDSLCKGATIHDTWEEYKTSCEALHTNALSYTRFYEKVRGYKNVIQAAVGAGMPPGRLGVMGWLHGSIEILDNDGVVGKGWVFYYFLPFSQKITLSYGRSKSTMDTAISAASCIEAAGVVPEIIFLDNVRAAYDKTGSLKDQVRQVFTHFRFDLARPDDISEEVLKRSHSATTVLGKELKDDCYTSIETLEEKINLLLSKDSENVLWKHEADCMRKIPEQRFEVYDERDAVIQTNLHVQCDGTYYSVPYRWYFDARTTKVRRYRTRIEIWCNDCLAAVHRITADRYCTDPDHMPPEEDLSMFYVTGSYYVRWAASIGQNTRQVISNILSHSAIEQQAYKTCEAILHLADRCGRDRLELVCTSIKDGPTMGVYSYIKKHI